MITEPDFTQEELDDMEQWNLDREEVGRCSNCQRTVYIGLTECRYCGTVFTSSPSKESRECDICGNDMLFNQQKSRYFCPINHSVFDL